MTDQALIDAARTARERAYAPYSRFKVGAALQLADGRIISAANVENCSYGLTLCAERCAVVMGVSQGLKPGDITRVAVVADAPQITAPCGACRQVLAEFVRDDAKVVMFNVRDGQSFTQSFAQLFPAAFKPDHLDG